MNKPQTHYAPDNNLITWYMHINQGMIKPLRWQKPLFQTLQAAVTGKISKILISAPPQHGKTMLTINAFTSWYMLNNPDDKVILTAYSQQRATKYGLTIRNIINRYSKDTLYKPRLSQDQHSKTNFTFEYPHQGELLATGSHGSIMGNPANLIVIDDPIKELRDATSQLMQENLDDWYVGSVNTRLRKNDVHRRPILLVVAQRLNKHDLQGILQEKYKVLSGVEAMKRINNMEYIPTDTVVNLNFPALCEDPETDILRRQKGEALWPSHKSTEDLMVDRKMMGEYRFKTIMQGDPQDLQDYLFTRDMFYDDMGNLTGLVSRHTVPPLPIGRFWDTAARSNKTSKVKKHGDYYSGIQVGYDLPREAYYCFGLQHGKNHARRVAQLIASTAKQDGFQKFTYIAQEPGSMSPMFLSIIEDYLRGYKVHYQPEKDNKVFRSIELQSVCNRGALYFVVDDADNPRPDELKWIKTIIDELCAFDGMESDASKGKHDDIVDSLSSAINFYYLNKHLYPNY